MFKPRKRHGPHFPRFSNSFGQSMTKPLWFWQHVTAHAAYPKSSSGSLWGPWKTLKKLELFKQNGSAILSRVIEELARKKPPSPWRSLLARRNKVWAGNVEVPMYFSLNPTSEIPSFVKHPRSSQLLSLGLPKSRFFHCDHAAFSHRLQQNEFVGNDSGCKRSCSNNFLGHLNHQEKTKPAQEQRPKFQNPTHP